MRQWTICSRAGTGPSRSKLTGLGRSSRSTNLLLGEPAIGRHRDEKAVRRKSRTASPCRWSRQRLCGSLRSIPDCRTRRAFLHLSYSRAPSYSNGIREHTTRTGSAERGPEQCDNSNSHQPCRPIRKRWGPAWPAPRSPLACDAATTAERWHFQENRTVTGCPRQTSSPILQNLLSGTHIPLTAASTLTKSEECADIRSSGPLRTQRKTNGGSMPPDYSSRDDRCGIVRVAA